MNGVVNLNKFRKAKQRAEKTGKAAANRAKFGRTKAEKRQDEKAGERDARIVDGAKRDDSDS